MSKAASKIIKRLKQAVRSARCDHAGASIKRVAMSEGVRARRIIDCPKCGARITEYSLN